jgi:hypothetical protein
MAVAAQVGCGWCLDIGYFQAHDQNLDLATISSTQPTAASGTSRCGDHAACASSRRPA